MTHGEGSAAAIRSPGTAAAFRRFPWWTAPSGASNRRQRCPASAPLGPSRRRLGRLRRRAGRSRAGSEIAEGVRSLSATPPPFPKNTSPKGVCSSSPNRGGDPQGGDPRVSAPLLRPPCPAPGEQTASPTRGNPPALQGWRRGASLRRTVGTAASPTAICAPYFCQAPFGKEVFHPDTWLWGQEDGFGLRSFACERWIGRDVTADEWQ